MAAAERCQPSEPERYDELRHHLGIVSQLAMMEDRQPCPEQYNAGLASRPASDLPVDAG
jgi:hypothetical protein